MKLRLERKDFKFVFDIPAQVYRTFGFTTVASLSVIAVMSYLTGQPIGVKMSPHEGMNIEARGSTKTEELAAARSTVTETKSSVTTAHAEELARPVDPAQNNKSNFVLSEAEPVPMPTSRPYGRYYVLVRAQGDGEGNYVVDPNPRRCKLDGNAPPACFMHPRDRRKFPVMRDR
jgi:hypothetical protein